MKKNFLLSLIILLASGAAYADHYDLSYKASDELPVILYTDVDSAADYSILLDASNGYQPTRVLATGNGYLSGITAGTVTASKAVVVDANKDIAAFRNLTVQNLDAGASGTVGTVDIFPTTASKGKVQFTVSDQTGNTTVTNNFAAMGQATVLTVPDPLTSTASYVLTESAQTINGVKTLGSIPLYKSTNAITCFAGGGQGSAVALASTINRITTCATAHDSVKLPTGTAGSTVKVINDGAAAADVYPASGEAIGSLAVNTPVTIPAGREAVFDAAVAAVWSEKRPTPIAGSYATGTTTTTFAAGQLTGASYVTYNNTQGTPGSIATRTATQMFQDDPQARVGGTYILRIKNGQGTGTLTVTAGSGVTLTGTATIAINTYRDFLVTYTSATALVIQSIGTGTDS